MTRQVTASAAMTLAVLMSSLEEKIIQHNQPQQTNKHYSLNCCVRCEKGSSITRQENLHCINGTGTQCKCSHTLLHDWHYTLLYLTSGSSSSDENASSDEFPKSQESSESVSQESIFHSVKSHSDKNTEPGRPSRKILLYFWYINVQSKWFPLLQRLKCYIKTEDSMVDTPEADYFILHLSKREKNISVYSKTDVDPRGVQFKWSANSNRHSLSMSGANSDIWQPISMIWGDKSSSCSCQLPLPSLFQTHTAEPRGHALTYSHRHTNTHWLSLSPLASRNKGHSWWGDNKSERWGLQRRTEEGGVSQGQRISEQMTIGALELTWHTEYFIHPDNTGKHCSTCSSVCPQRHSKPF